MQIDSFCRASFWLPFIGCWIYPDREHLNRAGAKVRVDDGLHGETKPWPLNDPARVIGFRVAVFDQNPIKCATDQPAAPEWRLHPIFELLFTRSDRLEVFGHQIQMKPVIGL